MFDSFMYLLRAKGINVSVNEWLSLNETLDKGLAYSRFTDFLMDEDVIKKLVKKK